MSTIPLETIKNLVTEAVNFQRLEQGRGRQQAVAEGRKPDYAPLLLGYRTHALPMFSEDLSLINAEHFLDGGLAIPEIADYPHYAMIEQVQSPAKMLYEALWGILSWARAPSDAQLSIRLALISSMLTCFGVEYEINDQGCAWFSKPIDLDRAINADVTDLAGSGQVPMVLDYLRFFKEHIVPGVKIGCPIAMGPFNIIDAMLGTDLWLLLHDAPDKIHVLMAKITDVIIRLVKLYKEVLGESLDTAEIGPLYLARGGVKIGSDSMVMVSPAMYKEFVHPYTERLCREFSGGYHHSCGYYPKHFEFLCRAEHLTCINFGQPELWDVGEAAHQLITHGKFYYGGWDRKTNEPIEEYLRRGVEICGPDRNRAILYAYGEREPWPEPSKTMELWHRLQDDMYPS